MKFPAIVNERLSDKVVNMLTDQIKSGQLKPGDKLPNEPELANTLQVSRGVLREALTILQAQNIIYRKPKEGTFINTFAPSLLNETWAISMKKATYLDLLEVRECMEIRMIEKVIDLATDSQIDELYDLIQPDAGVGKDKTADYYFHYRLAEFSQNTIFVGFIDTYYDIFHEITSLSLSKNLRKDSIHNEHKEIVDAIKARDKNLARKKIRGHLHNVKISLKEIN
ncbi:MAG: FadR family transcriptional regulator [Anaerolineaceae bacterium]|nr:MAG: FadR family transcriptional regulator [Anaerolineaceae bacterium]